MALVDRHGSRLRLAVVDGLGHGPLAHEAAQRAIASLRVDHQLDIQDAVLQAHERLAATRGATLGVIDLDLSSRTIRATTVGNVRVALFFSPGRVWSPCGTDAVLGHGRGGLHGRLEVRIEQHSWPEEAILALFSDGLSNQLRLPWQRVALDDLAAQLFVTFSVATDDATLLLVG
jgi:serine/threonine protein phosphatase PrpC